MRRVVSLIMVGLGVFAVTLAVLLPTYVYNTLAKVPLAQDSTTVLEGEASRVLAVGEDGPVVREDVRLEATARVVASFASRGMDPSTDYAVWVQAVRVTDAADDKVVSARKRQVCFDRRTMRGYEPQRSGDTKTCGPQSSFVVEMTDPPPEGGEYEPVRKERTQAGLNFKYPFGVEKEEYRVYQPSVGEPVNAEFVETASIDGQTVYKFVQRIPTTPTGTESVPGSLLGLDTDTVQAERTYQGTVTAWVEPVTGLIVKQRTEQHQELRVPGTDASTVIFDGQLTYTEQTVAAKMARARESIGKLSLLSTTGPWVLGPFGGLLVVGGVVLLIRSRRDDRDSGDIDGDTHRHRRPVDAGF